MMKKLLLTIVAVLSVFAANAYPDSIENTSVKAISKSYAEVSDSVIDRMDIITANTDSIRTQIANVDKNTRVTKLFGLDINWVLAIITILLTFIDIYWVYKTWKEQKKTSDSVMRASYNAQKGVFDDLVRHLYRNLVCTLAFSLKMLEKKTHTCYPSEEHLLKLKVLSGNGLQLENYNNSESLYQRIHQLQLQFRNYDIEIESTLEHLKNKNISPDTIVNDLGSLLRRPLYLIEQIRKIINEMGKEKNGNKDFDAFKEVLSVMTCAHIKKLMDWKKTKGTFNSAAWHKTKTDFFGKRMTKKAKNSRFGLLF